jgi:hypothetical protein
MAYQCFISWLIISCWPVKRPSVFHQILRCLTLFDVSCGVTSADCTPLSLSLTVQWQRSAATSSRNGITYPHYLLVHIGTAAPDWPSLYNSSVCSPLATNSKGKTSLHLSHNMLAINRSLHVYDSFMHYTFLPSLTPSLVPKCPTFP